MFLLVVLACIALANAHGSYSHVQRYRFGNDNRDHHSRQYREEVGNVGVGSVEGSYGFVGGRGNILYNDYAVGAGHGAPVYGGYGLGYGGYGLGYGVYGLGSHGYDYGGALGYNGLLRGYGDLY